MKASIIIANRNGENLLKQCLPSVRDAISGRNDVEVILADNGSTDQSITVTKQILPGAKILSLDRNYGFAEANNKAATMAQGEYLVFLNNDTVVDRDWLQRLIEAADSDPSISICGSRIMFLDLRTRINHAGGKITMIGSGIDEGFGNEGEEDHETQCTGYACGASMLVRTSAFRQLGGFDPEYFVLCEDVDLSWRAWIAGFKVIHVPTSIVYHKFSGSWNQEEDKVYYWHRNCKANTIKNFEIFGTIRGLLLNLLFDTVRVVEGLRARSIRTVYHVFSGYLWIARSMKRILRARLMVSHLRRRSDAALQNIGVFASLHESILEYRRRMATAKL